MNKSVVFRRLLFCLAGVATTLLLHSSQLDLPALVPTDVGAPVTAGATIVTDGTVEIVTGGAGIGPRTDQFHFAAVQLTNDFDLKFRVSALANSDVLAKAGLMVRESLDPGAPFAGVFATPSAAGTHFQSRGSVGAVAPLLGNFPPNIPFGWLRLQRVGDMFTGYASYDGLRWAFLGSTSVTLADSYVGFAATSHSTNRSTRAVFRDLADAGPNDVLAAGQSRELEPPGPTTRRTALVISEIMYHPAPRQDGRRVEFIELYNSQPFFEDISRWRIEGDYNFTFPTNTVIPGGGFLLVAPVPADIVAAYGVTNVVGGFTNSLSHSQGELRLLSERGAIYLDIHYEDKAPWPVGADGSGHSLALVRPSYGERNAVAWATSAAPGGSPGAWEFLDADPRRNVVLNEVLTRAGAGGTGPFVELYNHSNEPVDLAGCSLGYDPLQPAYVFPNGTPIPARGFLALSASQLGFAFRVDAETLFLRAPAAGPVLDAVRFEPSSAGVSRGRYADGGPDIDALLAPTPGLPNKQPAPAPIVLNEVMYSPLTGEKDLQYIELFNATGFAINVGGWKLVDGIQFTFPANTTLAPQGYLVVARSAARLRTVYSNLTSDNCIGDFDGSLAGRGERVTLVRPEKVPDTDGGTRTVLVLVDDVTYGTGGQWGHWSDGGGSSLELIDPHANHRRASSWADSDESSKGRWTTIEATGALELGGENPDSLHIGMLGEGECLIDNIEVIGPTGTNLISNGDFESSTANTFAPLGNHIRSAYETSEGFESARSLRLRASGNMDTGANRVRLRIARPPQPGDTATIRARVRWLKGWPEMLMRFHGNWLEATGRMDVPLDLGTPGARNSRSVVNAGPSLSELNHFPVVPPAQQPVVVSVRADDPDGLSSLKLQWRADPSLESIEVPMLDDGTGGDAIAGDGLFSATIPGQNTGVVVAFYVTASDATNPAATTVFPAQAPEHEAFVRFGESAIANSFGTYRIWLTQKAVTTWRSRPNLSNEPVEGTLVYGMFRAIHGAGYRYSGSPYHQQFSTPTGECHYVWRLPADDLLLGTDNFNKVHGPGNGPFDDDTIQREQTVFWMGRQLGLPWLYRRYVNVYVNGSRRRTLMEDTQVPGGDMVESYFPDDPDGNLFKLNPWFEFDSTISTTIGFNNLSWCDLNDYLTGGVKSRARYRWNWQPRAAHGTVNDYSDVFALVNAANTFPDAAFIDAMEAQVDMEQWLRTFALNHAVGNWDSFGNRNAQNMYAYKPEHGPWRLFMWDVNIVLGNAGFSDGPTGDDLFMYNFSDGGMGRIYSTPKFRRMYIRALKEIANGPMQAAGVGALIDAKAAMFQTAGFNNTGNSIKTWIRTRVNYLNSQAEQSQAPFTAEADGVVGDTTALSSITLTGTAPLEAYKLTVNGQEVPVNWETENRWRIRVVLDASANSFLVEARDASGQVLAGGSREITIHYTGIVERASDKLVFTEIQYRPSVPGAEFVELMNTSTTGAFGVGGWRITGLGYTFPPGAILEPGQRFVVTADRIAFRNAYDPFRAVANDIWTGSLALEGETLRLIKPGTPPGGDETITSVSYSPQEPWPVGAAGAGSSLQLIDPIRSEDERIGNWAAVPPRDPNALDWKFAFATGKAGANGSVQLYLSGFPPLTNPLDAVGTFLGTITFGGLPSPYGVRFHREQGVLAADFIFDTRDPSLGSPLAGVSQVDLNIRFQFDSENRFVGKLSADGTKITGSYVSPGSSAPFSFTRQNPGGRVVLDDVFLAAGEQPAIGQNLLANGDFESALSGPWAPNGSHAASELTQLSVHGGSSALVLKAASGGDGTDGNAVVQPVPGLTEGQTYTLSFWYLGTTNGTAIMARLGDGALQVPVKLDPPKDPHNEYTPGYENTVAALLTPFPDLWLNEVSPNPAAGIPYAELINHGPSPLTLAGIFLGEPGVNLLKDALPAEITLAPGEFLTIALDGLDLLKDKSNLHSSFRPGAAAGALTLTRVADERTNILDFLRWENLAASRSWGHFPDANPQEDRAFITPTPGAPNSEVAPALPVRINEWMAGNTRFADPATGVGSREFDDWFELFNPNERPVDLRDFSLSDSLTDATRFRIPAGYSVPAGGHLLVWADNQPEQNQPTSRDLHVDFKLAVEGEAIALFSPEGQLVDGITFGLQSPDVSEGRPTDGATGPFSRFPAPSPGVSNSGQPPATAPLLQVPAFNAGQPELSWNTEAGRRYQLRSRESLDGAWENYGGPLTATGATLGLVDPRPLANLRFYQVVVVE